MNAFYVWLHGKLINIVFFDSNDSKEIKESLINHDGYDEAIVVRKER